MCRRTCIARHLYLALACRSTLASTHTHTLTHSHIRTYIIDLYIRLVYIAVDKCVNFRTLSLLAEWFASVHTQTYTYTYNVYYIYYIYICTSPLPVQPFASVHAQTHAHTHAHIRNRFIYTRTQTRTRICIHAIYLHTHVHACNEWLFCCFLQFDVGTLKPIDMYRYRYHVTCIYVTGLVPVSTHTDV